MTTTRQEDAIKLYAALMEEVKIRISAIDAGTGGALRSMLPPQIIREYCFLQIRLICELIALGCLVAHGDLERASKLQKEWAADKIMDELAKLHPDFFPITVSIDQTSRKLFNVTAGVCPLDRKQLISLYHECGGFLHKGSLKNLLKQNSPIQIHFPDITAKAQRLNDLLANHVVVMAGEEMVLLCALRAANLNNRVSVVIANRSELPLATAPDDY
jgi:hypothetical protein